MAPRSGTLEFDLATLPVIPTITPEAWELPGVLLVQASWEVSAAATEALLPPAMHPSIPPYATFSVMKVPISPAGTYTLASVRIIGRAGVRPRGYLLGSICDSETAADMLASTFGFRVVIGEVRFESGHHRTGGRASIDGTEVLDIGVAWPEPMSGDDMEWFDNLHLVSCDGEAKIIQIDPEYEYKEAFRGIPRIDTFVSEAFNAPGLELTSPVVGLFCRADTDLPTPRFVMDPVLPAMQGTTRLDR